MSPRNIVAGPGLRVGAAGRGGVSISLDPRQRPSRRLAASNVGALTLSTIAPDVWTDPGTANRTYAFCSFGSVDGFIPTGIDSHLVEVDTSATTSAERRVWIKAEWTPPAMFSFGAYNQPVWSAVTFGVSASAALNASVLPPHADIDPATGVRPYYIIPIGLVRWIYNSTTATGSLSLQSDDSGSIRSYIRNTLSGLVVASGGADDPPEIGLIGELIFSRKGAV